jgi:type III restriction enzyme
VNQQGERLRGTDVNVLTVIANESYEAFADNLQKEIQEQTGITFGVVEPHHFAAVAVKDASGTASPLGFEKSQELFDYLKAEGYIDKKGKVQDSLRIDIKNETLKLPPDLTAQRPQIMTILRKVAGRLDVKNADERQRISPRRAVLEGPDFKALWDRIKHKTTYRVHFDNERLVEDCIKVVNDLAPVTRTRLQWRKAGIAIGRAGVEAQDSKSASSPIVLDEQDIPLPDILGELQNRTQLTRRTIHRILTGSKRLADFPRNPQLFIENVAHEVSRAKQHAIVDGIKYERLGDSEVWGQELFEAGEISRYMKNLIKSDSGRAIYDYVEWQSDPERTFIEDLEKNEDVIVYAKLPNWFKVPTPLGPYQPDWAVLLKTPDGERLYLVVETKSTAFLSGLRDMERDKIRCGEKHFEAIAQGSNPAEYHRGTSLADVLAARGS